MIVKVEITSVERNTLNRGKNNKSMILGHTLLKTVPK